MNSLLERDGYVVKRNFFNNDATSVLNLYSFKSIQDQISVPGCPRDEVEHENSWNLNSHAAFDSILFTSTREMMQMCEVELIPTYYYARIYLNGADMNGHTDRESCQFSASINLGQSHRYPIFIQNKKTSKYVEIDLQPGDALIYKGIEQKHYRKLFTGNWYSQLFLHWVDTTQTDWFYDCKSTPSEIEKKYTDSWESILYKSS
tara:strand:- start:208 stop:819 length:612 start_codon:yes stop_codon:yes gene_type:complete